MQEEQGSTDWIEEQSTFSADEGEEFQSFSIQESLEEAEQENKISYYLYGILNEKEKVLYNEILEALADRKRETVVSTLNVDELNKIFTCVMADHPELFYVDGYQFIKYSVGDVITKIMFYGNYVFSEDEIREYQKQLQLATEDIITEISRTPDEYEMVKAVYEYVIFETDYDLNAENNQNILSVFLQHKSVCQGYAKAFQYLLQRVGIECTLVTGKVANDGHAWNIVKVNDAYYHVDPTWGDASYVMNDNDENMEIPPINYDYLLVSDEAMESTHFSDGSFPLPACNSIQDNYFVREGLLLQEFDMQQLKDIFHHAYQNGWKYLTLKASNQKIYDEIKTQLIDKQKIFDLLNRQTKRVAYTENQQHRTICFWLY